MRRKKRNVPGLAEIVDNFVKKYSRRKFEIDFSILCVTMTSISETLKKIYGGNVMAFVITDECLSCGSCAAQCPAEAIDMGDLHYEIDADKCLECGSCAAQCPAEAIVQE